MRRRRFTQCACYLSFSFRPAKLPSLGATRISRTIGSPSHCWLTLAPDKKALPFLLGCSGRRAPLRILRDGLLLPCLVRLSYPALVASPTLPCSPLSKHGPSCVSGVDGHPGRGVAWLCSARGPAFSRCIVKRPLWSRMSSSPPWRIWLARHTRKVKSSEAWLSRRRWPHRTVVIPGCCFRHAVAMLSPCCRHAAAQDLVRCTACWVAAATATQAPLSRLLPRRRRPPAAASAWT
ncbi:hypothetical protein VTK73DRAFT_3130 [Phialemonium thermophilum]|uniref:Uncharacterized protein n=1 Tax=Phialemonium thermophilum TaxID=223376 RepID=A0ABR3VL09_9PEZI